MWTPSSTAAAEWIELLPGSLLDERNLPLLDEDGFVLLDGLAAPWDASASTDADYVLTEADLVDWDGQASQPADWQADAPASGQWTATPSAPGSWS